MKGVLIFFAVVIMFDLTAQNVGINIDTPQATLHVADGNVLFSATGGLPGTPVSGPGVRMMWLPHKSAFRAGYVDGNQWDEPNIGDYSVVMGSQSIASGAFAVALGRMLTASGTRSTAFGDESVASGAISTAFGYGSDATGDYSIAMGYAAHASGEKTIAMGVEAKAIGTYSVALGIGTSAKPVGSTSVGMYNDYYDTPSPTIPLPRDRIFQIGNGRLECDSLYCTVIGSNAMTVLRNGYIGLGTIDPFALLHVADSSVIFSASGDVPVNPGPTPVEGLGRKLMWYPGKAAFRAGYVSGSDWDRDSIGTYSFAAGVNSKALGQSSTVFGLNARASNWVCVAMGLATKATGLVSSAFGENTLASGDNSTAIGRNTTASGKFSTSMGYSTQAKAYGATTVGLYNEATDTPAATDPQPTDRIFQIGNGSEEERSNAITVIRDGRTGIGVTDPVFPLEVNGRVRLRSNFGEGAGLWFNNPSQSTVAFAGMLDNDYVGFYGFGAGWQLRMHVVNGNVAVGNGNPTEKLTVFGNICATGTIAACSDERYKTNFSEVQNALAKVQSLDGVYYDWRGAEFPEKQFSQERQVGFIAQEVEAIIPEIVQTSTDGYKSVDYGRLTPVLVEAIKEQQAIIDALSKKNADFETQLQLLMQEIAELKKVDR